MVLVQHGNITAVVLLCCPGVTPHIILHTLLNSIFITVIL